MNRRKLPGLLGGAGFFVSLLMTACSDDTTSLGNPNSPLGEQRQCSIPQTLILDGGPGKDGIPALTNPPLVSIGDREMGYLADDDRVVGLILESGPVAIPLNIFWWHEIVNLDVSGRAVAITHCPLTGSSLGFDRAGVGGVEFGVSGLLFRNNLIMYDRSGNESLWRLQPADAFVAFWFAWPELYPEIKIWREGDDDSTLGRS